MRHFQKKCLGSSVGRAFSRFARSATLNLGKVEAASSTLARGLYLLISDIKYSFIKLSVFIHYMDVQEKSASSAMNLLVQAPFRLYNPSDGRSRPQYLRIGRRRPLEARMLNVVYPAEVDAKMSFGINMTLYNFTSHEQRKTPEIIAVTTGVSPTTIEIMFDALDHEYTNHYLGFEIHTAHDSTIPRYNEALFGAKATRIVYERVPFKEYCTRNWKELSNVQYVA